MRREKRWIIAEPHPDAPELAARLKVSHLLAQILLNRGLADPQECSEFLRPSLKYLHDPEKLVNLTAAAARIAAAIRDKQKIVIYGDYDVDGITATAILWHAIRLLGGEADFYIPHRLDEGYGLNVEAIAQICDQGAKLIVTVDCGITAIEEAQVARQRGVDLIITDHHEWHSENGAGAKNLTPSCQERQEARLPDCSYIVHPRLPAESGGADSYPNPYLCGAGVAFKLAWGIGQAVAGQNRVASEFRDFLVDATALAALGTIADVVPLIGENRVLAHFGLGGLKASKLTGLQALIASAGLTGRNLDSYHVGFLLAPRLNACGRMGHARLAVEMLTHASAQKATEIATYLEEQNRQRQTIERRILDQALAQIKAGGFDDDSQSAIVLAGENWHAGVIGIVASRIVDRFHRPTIMIATNGEGGQGSGRSIAGFHLSRALEACSSHLDSFGGHEMAAGLRLQRSRIEDFRTAFCEHARQTLVPQMLLPELKLEAVAQLPDITAALVRDLKRLGPFGHRNGRPLLCSRELQIATTPRRVGRTGEHLQILVRQGNSQLKCIAFNHGQLFDRLGAGVRIDLAFEPTINEFNGRSSVELEVRDIRFLP